MRQRDRQAAILAAIALFATLFLLAGAPRWATCISVGLCLTALAPYLIAKRELFERKPLNWFFVAALGATLFQLVPLPMALVELMSPHKAALIAANADALGESAPNFLALSVDVPLTLLELCKLAGYFAFTLAAMRIAQHRVGRQFLLGVVVLAALAVSICALIHGLLEAKLLFGFYAPRDMEAPRFLSPVLNRNHMAGLAALTAPLSLGLAFRSKGPSRIFWALAALTIVTAALLGGSRAGSVAIALGCVLSLGLNLVVARPEKEDSKARLAMVARVTAIAMCIGIVLAMTAGSGLIREFRTASADELATADGRVDLWRGTLDLSSSYWLTGVGRGAFEQAFTPFNQSAAKITFARSENEYLQAVADWGVPLAALIGAFLLLAAARAASQWKAGPDRAGAVAGLVAIAAHNLVDFSLEMPGVALCALTCMAALSPAKPRVKVTKKVRFVRWGAYGVAVVVLVLASVFARTPREDAERLSGPAKVEAAIDAWRRHPADFVAATHVARGLASERDARAGAVLNRALSFHRDHPSVHRVAGLLLLRSQRPEQALDEFRIAIRHSRNPAPAVNDLVKYFADVQVAVLGLPIENDAQVVALSRLLGKRGHDELNLHYLQRAAALLPKSEGTHRRLVGVAAAQGRPDLARRVGWKILKSKPTAAVGRSLAATELAAKNYVLAARAAEIVRKSVPLGQIEEVDIIILQARGYRGAGNNEKARAVLLEGLAKSPPRGRKASLLSHLVAVERSLDNSYGAKWAQEQLSRLTGADRKLDSTDQ